MFWTGFATVSRRGVPLMRGERHLQDAVLARQRHGLAVLGPHRRIEVDDSVLPDGVLCSHARREPGCNERKDNDEAARRARAQCPPRA